MSNNIIGIDLGTTNSLVGSMQNGKPEIFKNELGYDLTPSVVAVTEEGTIIVGQPAKDRIVSHPNSGKACFKRDMGNKELYKLSQKSLSPVECSALILKEMKRIAEMRLGEPVTRAVISVPAYFRDAQRNATLEAAAVAGLKVERIINEPTAAALAFGYKNPEKESNILVFDLGGGTFDITLLEVFDGVIEVKSSGGESHLGGEDYTAALLDHITKREGLKIEAEKNNRWKEKIDLAKVELSSKESTAFQHEDLEINISRTDLALAGKNLNARMRPIIRKCLNDARLSPEDINDVLLVGGASRMPIIVEIVKAIIPTEPNYTIDPDRAIALGACVQAALSAQDAAVDDIVLTDVSPHTLGIEIVRESPDGNHKEGYFAPVINRNSTLPTSHSQIFHTMHPKQDQVDMKIYQGESRLVSDNHFLGEILIKGLKEIQGQKNPGQVDVRFTYDMNGILEVELTILSSGKKLNKIFEQRPGTMTETEVNEAIKRLQPLKIHPRDSLPNRTKLEKANRLYENLNASERDELSQIINQFEIALDRQDKDYIEHMKSILDQYLNHYKELI